MNNIWEMDLGSKCSSDTLVSVRDIETVLVSTEKDCKIVKREFLDKYEPEINLATIADLGTKTIGYSSFDSISVRLRNVEKGMTSRLLCKDTEKWYLIERKNS